MNGRDKHSNLLTTQCRPQHLLPLRHPLLAQGILQVWLEKRTGELRSVQTRRKRKVF